MSNDHAVEMIQQVTNDKEQKRTEPDWKVSDSTILVVELRDTRLADIWPCISSEIIPDVYSTGFLEVWLADLSELEAYNDIELFCIKPNEFAGYHRRELEKPYG